MTLTLHYHPLASFCWKVLIAFHENDIPFESVIVDFGDPASREAFTALWPMAKMPVLVDGERGDVVSESTIIIDYLDAFHPGTVRFIPSEPERAWQVRFRDRFFDIYVHEPIQKIVADTLRPADARDPFGVDQAREQLRKSYAWLESDLVGKDWAAGERFTLADAAAAPALFYANTIEPFAPGQTALNAYLERLLARDSVLRVIDDARPYFQYFPFVDRLKLPAERVHKPTGD